MAIKFNFHLPSIFLPIYVPLSVMPVWTVCRIMQRSIFSNWCDFRKYIFFVLCCLQGFLYRFLRAMSILSRNGTWINYRTIYWGKSDERIQTEIHESSPLILVLVSEAECCCPWTHIFTMQRQNSPWGPFKSQMGKYMLN